MTTINDVAQYAGVSKNTVSRYLNNRGYISQMTREKIRNAINVLQYHPNQIARSLYSSRTNLVGLVIPDVTQPFFSTMTACIEDQLDRRGYKMILCDTKDSSSKEKKYLEMLQENKVDGIIIGSHSIDIRYSDISAPIVALDRNLADDIPVVSANHEQGGRIAAQAFIRHGCKKVIQLVGYTKVRTPSGKRHAAFGEEMMKHGIACHTYELGLNQFDFDSYLDVADMILDRYPDLDGVFAADMVALAVQKRALTRGLSIPADLLVFGYDGSFMYKTAYPPLPTIVQPYRQLAKVAVSVLMKLINKEQVDELSYTIDVKPSMQEEGI